LINVVVLMGRICFEPELRHTPNDVAVTTIRLAVDRPKYKDKEQETDFVDVTAWRGTAEFISRYFPKGSMIAVQGSLRVDNYTDKDGNKRTKYAVQADNVSFCGSKKDNAGANVNVENDDKPAGSYVPDSAPAYSSGDTGDFQALPDDDDLPF